LERNLLKTRAQKKKLTNEEGLLAIKKVKENHPEAQFIQEVSIMGKLSYLDNEHFAQLICFTVDPRCIVTPLYDGSLKDLIHKKENEYTSLHLMDILYQTLSALKVMHEQELAHRDIKPGNILLEKRVIENQKKGSPGYWSNFGFNVRVSDFGICFVSEERRNVKIEVVNPKGFSIPYAAPELFRIYGSSSSETESSLLIFQQADIYAMGVTAWELLYRHEPWEGKDKKMVQEKVTADQRPILDENYSDNKLVWVITMIKESWVPEGKNRKAIEQLRKELVGLMELEKKRPAISEIEIK